MNNASIARLKSTYLAIACVLCDRGLKDENLNARFYGLFFAALKHTHFNKTRRGMTSHAFDDFVYLADLFAA